MDEEKQQKLANILIPAIVLVFVIAAIYCVFFAECDPAYKTNITSKLDAASCSIGLIRKKFTAVWPSTPYSPEEYPKLREEIKTEAIKPLLEIIKILEEKEAEQSSFVINKPLGK